jgi:hypothetical protein
MLSMASHLATGLLICAKCGKTYSYKMKYSETTLKSGIKKPPIPRPVYCHEPKTDCPVKPKEYKESVIDTAIAIMYYDFLIKNHARGTKIQLAQIQHRIDQIKQKLIAEIRQEVLPSELLGEYRTILYKRDKLLNNTTNEYVQRQAYKSFLLFRDSDTDNRIELIKNTLGNVNIISGILTTGYIQKPYMLEGLDENFDEYLSLMESLKIGRDRGRTEEDGIEELNVNLLMVSNQQL